MTSNFEISSNLHRSSRNTFLNWGNFSEMDVPMLDVETDPMKEDIWFNQWVNDLPRLTAEDGSPRNSE